MKFVTVILAIALTAAVTAPDISSSAAAAPIVVPPMAPQRTMPAPMFSRQGNRAMFNHHWGYRRHVPGYRYYNGYWFPPAAFIGFAFGALAARAAGDAHTRWCETHYRSYRRSDDTFQPYNGPRRPCVAPVD